MSLFEYKNYHIFAPRRRVGNLEASVNSNQCKSFILASFNFINLSIYVVKSNFCLLRRYLGSLALLSTDLPWTCWYACSVIHWMPHLNLGCLHYSNSKYVKFLDFVKIGFHWFLEPMIRLFGLYKHISISWFLRWSQSPKPQNP